MSGKSFAQRSVRRRRTAAGTALLESIILLMILMTIFAFTFRLAPAMNMKAKLTTHTRYRVWRQPAQWHHHWDVDNDRSWTAYDAGANGMIPSPAVAESSFDEYQMKRPRGDGEALDHLYSRIGSEIVNSTSDGSAQDYLRRLWNNLPGRKQLKATHLYEVVERMPTVAKILGLMISRYQYDTAPWVHSQMPAWLIAQHGPMREINDVFHQELSSVPPELRRMAREVLHAWFEEEHMYNWNHQYAVQP